jgi:SAM-dependent methyltransferase
METRNIFLYWVNKEYKLISILRNLIYLHSTSGIGYKIHLITDKNIGDYIKVVPCYFSKLCPAHQADFVRVNVICDYGGIWLDSDTLVLDSLDSLFDYVEKKDGFFIKNNVTLVNSIFGSKANTPLMIEWKTEMIKILDKKQEKIDWCEIGNIVLTNLHNKNSGLYDNYKIFNGLDNIYPVNWDSCVTEFIEKPYNNYETIVREYQPLLLLVNSVYKKLENKTVNEILKGNMPINYFINKSFENKKNNNLNNIINSTEFTSKLKILNNNLKDQLEKNNFLPILIGNLFYDHAQPNFYNSPLLDDCHEKRIRFSKACSMRNTMFEIGLNGGHSAFLALMSNKNLKIYSNDISQFYPPFPKIHPEIYVQIAADTLKTFFDNRFTFIKGDCLTEIPKFIKNNPSIKFDIIHIDGEKSTYKQDFLNLIPSLNENAIVIFDHSQQVNVQKVIDELINCNYLYRLYDFPKMNTNIKYRNEILVYKNKNQRIFENIYKKCLWNHGDANIPSSGPGSSLKNTKEYSKVLTEFIYNNECKSVLDLGCGDLTWIPKTQFFNDNSIKYTGVDVVESLITRHLKNFSEKNFLCKDITTYNDFDKVDIIIIRDVIFHLTNDEILSIFDNIKNKFNFLFITNCRNNVNTDNFDKWRFSEKNILIGPFNKSQNFIMKIDEPVFNRDVLIYSHNNFYNL